MDKAIFLLLIPIALLMSHGEPKAKGEQSAVGDGFLTERSGVGSFLLIKVIALPWKWLFRGSVAYGCVVTPSKAQTQTLKFEAEVTQLLHLVAHSLYSNKEIFLRELISNRSDAADKLRYYALSDSSLYEGETELKMWVEVDKENRTITIRDNGIQMTRDEVIHNLGTIAQSLTRTFRELLAEKKREHNQNVIGQFGVGGNCSPLLPRARLSCLLWLLVVIKCYLISP